MEAEKIEIDGKNRKIKVGGKTLTKAQAKLALKKIIAMKIKKEKENKIRLTSRQKKKKILKKMKQEKLKARNRR